ncbi:MAG: M20 family metallo-hydrolase [Bdellovibrionota bacterium]
MNKGRMNRADAFLARFKQIGAMPNGGGVTRLGYSAEERAAHTELGNLVDGLDVELEVDAAGNTFVFNRQACHGKQVVLVGSHLDTVPCGGNFDGVTGVVAGLEIFHLLAEHGLLHTVPFKLMACACEESSRFSVSSIGMRIALGMFDARTLTQLSDAGGTTLYDAMEQTGLRPSLAGDCRSVCPSHTKAFLELHVEQGPVLDAESLPIALVTAISAPIRFCVKVFGEAQHSGATPMKRRRDALVSASRLIAFVDSTARSHGAETCVATIGRMELSPNATNVVPGSVRLWVDVRDVDCARRNQLANDIEQFVRDCETTDICLWEVEKLQEEEPQVLSGIAYDALAKALSDVRTPCRRIVSGAGHDSLFTARAGIPTGMLFVPSIGGISHQPGEDTAIEDIELGIDVLYRAVLELGLNQP